MRKIKVCAGIGDNIWLLQKLINSGEQFDFELPDGKPQRGKQIFDLLPQVANSATYVPGLTYKKLADRNIQNTVPLWENVKLRSFYLSANTHLERGKRIEEFLPDLPTTFRIPWNVQPHAKLPTTKYIGIYGSSYSTSRSWGFWDANKWFELIKMIHKHDPQYTFILIGAEWDLDLVGDLVELIRANNFAPRNGNKRISYVNTVGSSLGSVIEVMHHLDYFFSFPSGLGILAPTVGCPVTMFYPKHLRLMMNAWASPEDIETGLYKGTQFCEPDAIFKWVIDNKKI